MLSPEQIEARKKYIGASDARRIIDGDWFELWAEKTSRSQPEDLSKVWAVQLGSFTESLNLDWYEVKTGTKATRRGESVISPEHSFLAATLDGFDPAIPALLECKHVNGFSKLPDVVARYTPQVLHQMHCAQIPHGFLSIIIGANEPVLVEVEYDEFYLNEYVDRCREFWAYVVSDVEPPGAPAALAAPAPIEKMRTVDMQGNNAWSSFAADWKENQKAAKKFDEAVKGIKGLVESDVKLATGHGVKVSRDGRGLKIGEI